MNESTAADQIDRYLLKQMPEDERVEFEDRMASDLELFEEVERASMMIEALRANEDLVESSLRTKAAGRFAWGWVVAAAAAMALSFWLGRATQSGIPRSLLTTEIQAIRDEALPRYDVEFDDHDLHLLIVRGVGAEAERMTIRNLQGEVVVDVEATGPAWLVRRSELPPATYTLQVTSGERILLQAELRVR